MRILLISSLIIAALVTMAASFTFDGTPSSPQSAYFMEDFDVQVHVRDAYNLGDNIPSMFAQHGTSCQAPPSGHHITVATDAVFICNDHIMTAINSGYGVIYLTPNQLLDWSDGEATLSIDVSTLRMSGRDWWDLWLTEWDTAMALPLSDRTGGAGTDLQGPPNGEWVRVTMNFEENSFVGETTAGVVGGGAPYTASSATDRDTFVLTINSTTFSFCKPDESRCWVSNQPHGLSVTNALVQIGHHTYDPTKAISSNEPGTWHWDNLTMSDSIPFTIIRANERSRTNGGTFTFDEPAPANAYLRFSAIGEISINGQAVSPQVPYYNWGHFNSYRIPIAAGTTSVTFSGTHPWGLNRVMKDVSIFSLTAAQQPTATPTETATNTPVPTNTPTPVPTNTPTPEPTPTNTPVPDVCHAAIYRNGVLEMGPVIACP